MPYDPAYDEEDEKRTSGEEAGQGRRLTDFDCPECAANNPYDEGFGHGDEIRCYYCGQEFRAEVSEAGKLRLRPI